MEERYV